MEDRLRMATTLTTGRPLSVTTRSSPVSSTRRRYSSSFAFKTLLDTSAIACQYDPGHDHGRTGAVASLAAAATRPDMVASRSTLRRAALVAFQLVSGIK